MAPSSRASANSWRRWAMSKLERVQGEVAAGFEPVREAFAHSLAARDQLGAACCIHSHGRVVVDLWGGWQDRQRRRSWQRDTLLLVFSLTKGMTGLAAAVAVSRGLFRYEEPVATIWPEFAAMCPGFGKDRVTVGQLLSEQAGVAAIDLRLDALVMADQARLAGAIAVQKPNWTPGDHSGNHSYTLGWLASELIRRRDPKRRSLGRFFHDEIAAPLSADFWIGLPAEIDRDRLARIEGFNLLQVLLHIGPLPWRMVLGLLWPWSLPFRALNNPLLLHGPSQLDDERYRGIELGAIGGIGSARALATIYAEFASGGQRLGLASEVLQQLSAGHAPPRLGIYDQVLKADLAYSYGLEKPSANWEYAPSRSAFGTFAVGGSFAFADPEHQIGYAWVTNKLGLHKWDDPRELAVREAFFACIKKKG